jgi:hypothetical protein
MILSLTTVHENDAVIPLLAKEGLGVVDCWATPPPPLEEGSHFPGSEESVLSPVSDPERNSSPRSE